MTDYIVDFSYVKPADLAQHLVEYSNDALIAIEENAPATWKQVQVDETVWKELFVARFPDFPIEAGVDQAIFCRTAKRHLNTELFTHITKVKVDDVLGTTPSSVNGKPDETHRSLVDTLGAVYATFTIRQLAAMDVPKGLEYEHRQAVREAVYRRLLERENTVDVHGISFKERPAAFYGVIEGVEKYLNEKKDSLIQVNFSACDMDLFKVGDLCAAVEDKSVSRLDLSNNNLGATVLGLLEQLVEKTPLTVNLAGNRAELLEQADVLTSYPGALVDV